MKAQNILWMGLILVTALPAQAGFYRSENEVGNYDGYRATKVWWKNWQVSSSEELWKSRTHHQFPLSHLFDGDAATTWADSSSRKAPEKDLPWRNRFGLLLEPDQPVHVDELWIMNGYNKSHELFKRNDRIVEMQIWINDVKAKTVRLSDRMDWHKIVLPSGNLQNLGLLFTGIRKGNGPDNDVCISELELRYKGRKIEMLMPRSVFFEDGNYSGDAPLDCALISARDGKVITHGVRDYGLYEQKWSPKSDLVAGGWRIAEKASFQSEKLLLWVADVNRRRIIRRVLLPRQVHDSSYNRLVWLNENTVEVSWIDPEFQPETVKENVILRKQYKIN